MENKKTIQHITFEVNQNNRDYFFSDKLYNKIQNIADNILPQIVSKSFNVKLEDIHVGDKCTIYTNKNDELLLNNYHCNYIYMCIFSFWIKSLKDISSIFNIEFCLNAEINTQREIDKMKPYARTCLELKGALEALKGDINYKDEDLI